jgi:hypothetical protein
MCDPSRKNQDKLTQVIIENIARSFIFNYFSLIQSLTTLHQEDIEILFLQHFLAFFKMPKEKKKNTNAKLESLSWFSCDGSHIHVVLLQMM